MSVLERAARPLSGLSAGTFATLSRLRGHRVFHPYGEAFDAHLTFERSADVWMPVSLARPRRHEVLVRFSRGAGVPAPLPDVIGLAIKIPDIYGHGWDQDWLLVTSGADPVSRHLLVPTRDILKRPYSSVLPYRRPSGLVTFGAKARADRPVHSIEELVRVVSAGDLTFDFTVAPEGGDHVKLGTLGLLAVADTQDKRVRFNPWNTAREMRPAGALNELRRDTYEASQRARPDG